MPEDNRLPVEDPNIQGNSVGSLQVCRCQNFEGRADGKRPAPLQEADLRSEGRGKMRVVGGQHRGKTPPESLLEDFEEAPLVGEVQVTRRLVEEQDFGFLRQSPRKQE